MHSLNTFGVKMNHGQTRTHKPHHGPDLEEATTFPIIVYCVPFHEAHVQMTFFPGTPKWDSRESLELGLPPFWGPITLCVDLQLK